jgi:hypothetical protein
MIQLKLMDTSAVTLVDDAAELLNDSAEDNG